MSYLLSLYSVRAVRCLRTAHSPLGLARGPTRDDSSDPRAVTSVALHSPVHLWLSHGSLTRPARRATRPPRQHSALARAAARGPWPAARGRRPPLATAILMNSFGLLYSMLNARGAFSAALLSETEYCFLQPKP